MGLTIKDWSARVGITPPPARWSSGRAAATPLALTFGFSSNRFLVGIAKFSDGVDGFPFGENLVGQLDQKCPPHRFKFNMSTVGLVVC